MKFIILEKYSNELKLKMKKNEVLVIILVDDLLVDFLDE
jgi:hypothetical protein